MAELDRVLAGIEAGDTEALQSLYEEYGRQVYSLAYAITRDGQIAEEVTQDVFLKIWKKAEYYEPGTNFRAWLLRITRNLAIDHIRREKRHLNHVPVFSLDHIPDSFALPSDDTRLVLQALQELSEAQRTAIEMAFMQGLTHQQIADISKVPLGTIKTRIRDGLEKLRQTLYGRDKD